MDDKDFLYNNIFKLQGCHVIFQPHAGYVACIIKDFRVRCTHPDDNETQIRRDEHKAHKDLRDKKEYSACGHDIYAAFRLAYENMPVWEA